MKKLFRQLLLLTLVVAALTISAKSAYAATYSDPVIYKVWSKTLKVHTEPSIHKEVVGKLTQGTIVKVYETKTLGGGATWARITSPSLKGWVNIDFLRKVTDGWVKVDGIWRWFKNGKIKYNSNAMHTANEKIKGKSSGTSLYLVVDRKNFRVFAFQKQNGVWKPYRSMKCSVGKPGWETPTGTFSIFSRWGILKSGHSWEYYPVEFLSNRQGAYCFHSVLYYKGVELDHIEDAKIKSGTLGAAISHGCVRLSLTNAKWIYDYCKNGTKVLIY